MEIPVLLCAQADLIELATRPTPTSKGARCVLSGKLVQHDRDHVFSLIFDLILSLKITSGG